MAYNMLFVVRRIKPGNKIYDVAPANGSQNVPKNFCLQLLMKNVLTVGQCFGLIPVNGVRGEVENTTFRWLSFRIVHNLVLLILMLLYAIFMIFSNTKENDNFFSFVDVIYSIQATVTLAISFVLAKHWPNLMVKWREVEVKMSFYGGLQSLKTRFFILPLIFLAFGVVQYVLFLYGTISKPVSESNGFDDGMQKCFKAIFEDFFFTFKYESWKGFILLFLDIECAFIWQYCNLILVLLSSALAERFRQISKRIDKTEAVLNEAQWREIRNQYNGLCLLCKTLNDTISQAVLLSYFRNIYYLSISIYEIFMSDTKFETLYFAYQLLFNLFHFTSVSIYAAWVHEESIEPITQMSAVSSKNMSHEVDRLLHQMAARDIGIYGGGLFKVTRGVFLNVASVLVTLQLIFVQFNAKISNTITI